MRTFVPALISAFVLLGVMPRCGLAQANSARAQAVGFPEFQRTNPGWQCCVDSRSGEFVAAFGPAIRVAPPDPTPSELTAAANQLAKELLPSIYGADPHDQELIAISTLGHLHVVHFQQKANGFDIENAGLSLRIDTDGRLRMFGGSIFDSRLLASNPMIDRELARTVALASGAGEFEKTQAFESAIVRPRPIWTMSPDLGLEFPRLAWPVSLSSEGPAGPSRWEVFVDAVTGEVIGRLNRILNCTQAPEPNGYSGAVTGLVWEGRLPWETPIVRPMAGTFVNVGPALATTDASGNFVACPTGTGPYNVSAALGNPLTYPTGLLTPAGWYQNLGPGNYAIHFDNSNSLAWFRNVNYFTIKTHFLLKSRVPLENAADVPVGVVSIPASGNAFYDEVGLGMSFGMAGLGYYDMATIGTVVGHEYGHHICTRIFAASGRVPSPAFNEAAADVVAALTNDDPVIGRGWNGVGSFIRDLQAPCQYPDSCGPTPHFVGLILAGAVWDLRALFIQRLGSVGRGQFETMFFRLLRAAPATFSQAALELLLLDDNDGNLANGSPNSDLVYQAFTTNHSIPFPLSPLTIVHRPIQNTQDQLQGYKIVCSVAPLGSGTTANATIHWRLNGTPWQQIPMVQVGSGWEGTIPNQSSGSRIDYYIRALDTTGRIGLSPSRAPESYHGFATFRPVVRFREGFEVNAGGFTSGAVGNPPSAGSGVDNWVRTAPTRASACQGCPFNSNYNFDPIAAAEGSYVFGTAIATALPPNGAGQVVFSNPSYSVNTLQWLDSPSFNFSGFDRVRLRYKRWLSIPYDGFQGDQARVSVRSGNSPWSPVFSVAGITTEFRDFEWFTHDLDISSIADLQSNVQVQFELASNAFGNAGGWNVDEVLLTARDIARSAPLILSGASTPGQVSTLTIQGDPGDQFVIVAATAVSATHYDGIGTASIDITHAATLIPIVLDGAVPRPVD